MHATKWIIGARPRNIGFQRERAGRDRIAEDEPRCCFAVPERFPEPRAASVMACAQEPRAPCRKMVPEAPSPTDFSARPDRACRRLPPERRAKRLALSIRSPDSRDRRMGPWPRPETILCWLRRCPARAPRNRCAPGCFHKRAGAKFARRQTGFRAAWPPKSPASVPSTKSAAPNMTRGNAQTAIGLSRRLMIVSIRHFSLTIST